MTIDARGNIHDPKGLFGGRARRDGPDGVIKPDAGTRVPLGVIADQRAHARVRELDATKLYNDGTSEFAYTEVENEPFNDDTISCRVATGELADRIRAKFGVSTDTRVQITERTHEDGHSEWTSESFTYLEISAGGHTIEFDTEVFGSKNTLVQMLDWLDAA